MARDYLPVERDQDYLLPVSMRDWLPPEHLAWFVLDVVAQVDTSAFHASRRRGGVGRAGYDPDMLLGVLVYGYTVGQCSSRKIEVLCREHIAFRVLSANTFPDHSTLARFRRENLAAVEGFFPQVLALAARMGQVDLATVAIDGTKIAA